MSSLQPENLGCFLLGCVGVDWKSFPEVVFALIKTQFLPAQVDQGTEVEMMQIMGWGVLFEQMRP